MAVGSYGIVRPADVSPADVEILYHYVSGRTTDSKVNLKKLDSTSILTPIYHSGTTTSDTAAVGNEVLGGLYNLKLGSENFSELGIYTLYVRPKQIRTSIMDCGVLASLPSVRGLVIDLSNIPAEDKSKFTPQGLVGYRIEYINNDGTNQKIPNFYRMVTSCFYCTPIVTNLSNTSDKAVRYQYTDQTSNLMFLTITPSSSPPQSPHLSNSSTSSTIVNNAHRSPSAYHCHRRGHGHHLRHRRHRHRYQLFLLEIAAPAYGEREAREGAVSN
mgnify:CR=1 FL=1